MTIRSDLSGFGPLFDSADATAIVPRRTVSTVAPQALFLLNHPFVIEQAKALSKRLESASKDPQEKIRKAYLVLYGRPPSENEVEIGLSFIDKEKSDRDKSWLQYCQLLLSANEFMYVD